MSGMCAPVWTGVIAVAVTRIPEQWMDISSEVGSLRSDEASMGRIVIQEDPNGTTSSGAGEQEL
jgi:hypothetical protein